MTAISLCPINVMHSSDQFIVKSIPSTFSVYQYTAISLSSVASYHGSAMSTNRYTAENHTRGTSEGGRHIAGQHQGMDRPVTVVTAAHCR